MPHRARDTWLRIRHSNSLSFVIPGCALLGAGPESITTIGGYGFRARAEDGAPRNDDAVLHSRGAMRPRFAGPSRNSREGVERREAPGCLRGTLETEQRPRLAQLMTPAARAQ